MNVNGERLKAHIEALAKIGADPEGGVTRYCFTPEYEEAALLISGWMRDAGLTPRRDAAGNLIGRKEGTDPSRKAIAIGSHFDTVKRAGQFDGCFGVLGAIEIVQTLAENGVEMKWPLEVPCFVEEEGTRFGAGLLGSKAFAGKIDGNYLRKTKDLEGKPIADTYVQYGYDPDRIVEARRSPDELEAYFEMHIEQASVLDTYGEQLGIVEGIAGYVWLKAVFEGRADHAGATPMDLRNDAIIPASMMVPQAEKIALDMGKPLVITVGRMLISPGNINVVPGRVEMYFDIRDLSMDRVREAQSRRARGVLRDAYRAGERSGHVRRAARHRGGHRGLRLAQGGVRGPRGPRRRDTDGS